MKRFFLRFKNESHVLQFLEANQQRKVTYVSRILPLVEVEDELANLQNIGGVERISEARIGIYADGGDFQTTIISSPNIPKRVLISNQYVGWGDTKVAVIDSGVSLDGFYGENVKDFTGLGMADTQWHGTNVVRLIKHYARGAHIFVAKVESPKAQESSVMKALEWAYVSGARIVNISIGFTRGKQCKGKCDLCELVDVLRSRGMLVIAAAGNKGKDGEGTITCPAASKSALAVGAVDVQGDSVAEYSSRGLPGQFKPNIVTTGTYTIEGELINGTSFAAPTVTGILAATLSPKDSTDVLLKKMCNTARSLGVPQNMQGYGALNLERYVEVLKNEESNSESKRHQ